jgi:hypothetical protein
MNRRLAHGILAGLTFCALLLTSACAVPLALGAASYAGDGALMMSTNKTSTDHFASMVSKKDCALWRAFQGQTVCREREGGTDPYDVDYSHPERTAAEDGVHYTAPLRSSSQAPASSWTAAPYEPAPAARVPQGDASPAAPAPSTAKPTKAAKKVKPAAKPVPDPAGSRS